MKEQLDRIEAKLDLLLENKPKKLRKGEEAYDTIKLFLKNIELPEGETRRLTPNWIGLNTECSSFTVKNMMKEFPELKERMDLLNQIVMYNKEKNKNEK